MKEKQLLKEMSIVINLLSEHMRSPSINKSIQSILAVYQKKIVDCQQIYHPTQKNNVFVNNYLNLAEVKVVGFDLDYTLVTYTNDLQDLIYNMARDILVDQYGFPPELRLKKFDPTFAIRGLSVDIRNGILCKLSYLQHVAWNFTYRGKKRLLADEIEKIYGRSRHIPYGDLGKMRPLNDMYTMAEACLIADTIDVFEDKYKRDEEVYSPVSIIDDIQSAVREVHVSGSMQKAIVSNLSKFVKINTETNAMLSHLKLSGKKLFLCTNSGYKYTSEVLPFALGIPRNEKAKWRGLFDRVICAAKKPDFYKLHRPFRIWKPSNDTASTALLDGTLNESNVYINGSADGLTKSFGCEGKDILYVGDNLPADLIEARRCHGWHTAYVISELNREIDIQNSESFRSLHFLRSTLRNTLTDLQMEMQSSLKNSPISGKQYDDDHLRLLQSIEQVLQAINSELSQQFNPQFGSVFRTDGHPSLLAFTMRRYTDLYMNDVSNLLHHNPTHRFFPTHAIHMAHDPILPSIITHHMQ